MKLFKKILIANRGEIAVRVIRAARSLGIQTVAICTPADESALHIRMADESFILDGNDLNDTYLNIKKIIQLAKLSECEAIHPGYGFLAENPKFVQACEKEEIVFIGPSSRAIRLMGNKIESRAFVTKLGIPVTKGVTGDINTLKKSVQSLRFPVLVKAAGGGGGKGMRIVKKISELDQWLESTSREAKSYFGDGTVYIEEYIKNPRHIEIQVLGDKHGNVIHLFERECSIQRRYQKIIEESPSVTLTNKLRNEMGKAAVQIAEEIGYSNAGTIEFLVDSNLNYYFLEMNTRIQVEHPVTELVTGVDLVKEQIKIAAGKEIDIKQEEIKQKGHAIECRIYAEDPENSFLPSPGEIILYSEPSGLGIRVDSGIDGPTSVESSYDPLISKLICYGSTREQARNMMVEALNQYAIHGIKSNIVFLKSVLNNSAYIQNQISTAYCDQYTDELIEKVEKERGELPEYQPAIAAFLFSNGRKNIASESLQSIWQKIGYWRNVMEPKICTNGQVQNVIVDQIQNHHAQFYINDKLMFFSIKELSNESITLGHEGSDYCFYVSMVNPTRFNISYKGFIYVVTREDILSNDEESETVSGQDPDQGIISSPMPGKVIKVHVAEKKLVQKGNTLIVVEAMKMENHLQAPFDGKIDKINVKEGDSIDADETLIVLKK